MTLHERYRAELARGLLLPDPAQAALVDELERVHRSLASRRDGGMVARLARRLARAGREPVPGLYVWGGVGRGKTHLVDLFFASPTGTWSSGTYTLVIGGDADARLPIEIH